jgi:formylglycine-generating enzyme required for sulfatase activity
MSPFWFGAEGTDYAPYANLADHSLRRLATDSWNPKPPDLVARDDRYNDGHLVTADVGSFAPNAFGLYDMHGNVAEWTLGRHGSHAPRRTVRGGSWRDLPQEAHASARVGYYSYQKIFNVGFRVVVEDTRTDPAN